MEEIQLQNWTVRPLVGGICVDGKRIDDANGDYWHSSSIVKRISGRLLETSSGSRYRLIGDCDPVYARKVSDYLYRLNRQFKCGFPKKWKSLIMSAARAAETKQNGNKNRQITKTSKVPNCKIPATQNGANEKELSRTLKIGSSQVNLDSVNCHTNERAILLNKRTSKQIRDLRLHSVTRSTTKKLGQVGFGLNCKGTSWDDTLDDTILALRGRNLPFGRTLRKRKQPSYAGVASKKRKVEGRSIRQSDIPDVFPTPAFQNNDVVLECITSRSTSLKKRKGIAALSIEPDILTLESLVLSPEDASKEPCKVVSARKCAINPVVARLCLDEDIEEDILQKSFMDCDSKRHYKLRSQTVHSKLGKAPDKQRNSRSQAPSKSRSVRSREKSPDRNLKLVTICGGHNLRPRTVKKNATSHATAEPQRNSARLRYELRFDRRKQQVSKTYSKCESKQHVTAKKLPNSAVAESKASRNPVTVKSSLGKVPPHQMSANCEKKRARGNSRKKMKSGLKSGSQNRAYLGSFTKSLPCAGISKRVVVGTKSDEVPKSVTPSVGLTSDDEKLRIAERSAIIELMKVDGREGQYLEKDCQNRLTNGIHMNPLAVEASLIPAKTLRSKATEEREGKNDELKESNRYKTVKMNKMTGGGGTRVTSASASMTCVERVRVLVKSASPKGKKTVVTKNKNSKKKTKGTVATMLNKTENGQRTLQLQESKEPLGKNISSKTNAPLEVEPIDECCLTKCLGDHLTVDTKLKRRKDTRKRKMAEIPASVIDMKKIQPKTKDDQKVKASDKDDSFFTRRNDQVTSLKLLGGRGTLKRQKALRQLVEKNMQCKDSYDFFSSTPFQNTQARRFVIPQFEDGDDIFAEVDLSKAVNYEKADVTPHGLFHVMDYTANKTPATTPNTSATPAGIKRRRSEQEAYIHRVKKILRLGQRKGLLRRNILKKTQPGISRMPVPSLDKDLLEVGRVEQPEDSEPEDYYFADD